jgi:Transposase IS66 family
MKPRCPCRCTMAAAKTMRPIYGNTADREGRRSSSSGLAGSVKAPSSFQETLKESSKAMDTCLQPGGWPQIVHAACWAHARRKFIDAVKLNALDQESIEIVEKMDQLFRVDRVACERGLPLEARHALRNEESKPIISIVKTCRRQQIAVREYLRAVLPGSETSQQIGSTN